MLDSYAPSVDASAISKATNKALHDLARLTESHRRALEPPKCFSCQGELCGECKEFDKFRGLTQRVDSEG